jgi:hypothetical protein
MRNAETVTWCCGFSVFPAISSVSGEPIQNGPPGNAIITSGSLRT